MVPDTTAPVDTGTALGDPTTAAVPDPTTPIVNSSLGDVAAATAPVTSPLDQSLSDLTAATAPVIGGVDESLADVPRATGLLAGGVDQSFGDVTAATGPLGAAVAFPTGDSPAAVAFHYPEAGTVGAQDVALSVPPGEPPLTPSDVADTSGVYAPTPDTLGSADGGSISIMQMLGTGYVTWKLAILSVVLASLTRWSGNVTGCFTSVRMLAFTNVQLIRCGFVSPVTRMAAASVAAVTHAVGVGGGGAHTAAVRLRHSPFGGLFTMPKVVARLTFAGDRNWLPEMWKILALVYGVFLAVWFWAGRIRRNHKLRRSFR
jgi:hypothetical protein